jgi:hypothetical protein
MFLDVAIYGLSRGSLWLASPFDDCCHIIADYLTFFKQLTLLTFKDTSDGRVLDVGLSQQETCAILIYFVPMIVVYLYFSFECGREIQTC